MKRLVQILSLSFFFIFLVLFLTPKGSFYKVLRVTEGDAFYIDINKNGEIDGNELVKIKDIKAFPLKFHTDKKLGLKPQEGLKLGYTAKMYTKSTLEGQDVYVRNLSPYNKGFYYRTADVYFQNGNFAQKLLEEGYANASPFALNREYLLFENVIKQDSNKEKTKNLKIVLLNSKNGKYHYPECDWAKKIKNYEVISAKEVPEDEIICSKCNLHKSEDKKHFKKYSYPPLFKSHSENINPSFATSVFKFYFINPLNYRHPSSSCRTGACKMILNEINNAKTSIDISIYGIEKQDEIINALLKAKRRGVKIRAVVDEQAQDIYKDTPKFKSLFGAKTDTDSSKIMHNKVFIFDGKKVVTGSANISQTGTGGYNANIVVLINDSEIAKSYVKEFEQMYCGKFQLQKTKHYLINRTPGDSSNANVYFLPDKEFIHILKQRIDAARKYIYVSAFFLTNKDFADALISAKQRGINIKVISDATGARNNYSKISALRNAGISVKTENWGGKNHGKVVVIDGTYIIFGSMNFTNAGMYKNDENVIILKHPNAANAYSQYFMTLYNSIPNKYLTKNPRPEGLESKYSCFDEIDNDYDGLTDFADPDCQIKNKDYVKSGSVRAKI